MEKYLNLSSHSGIVGYEIENVSITVYFNSRYAYKYDNFTPGESVVNQMKYLAIQGRGLNTFINKYVGQLYHFKFRY